MAVAFGPTFCSSVLVLKSELLHSPEAQYGFCSKNTAFMVVRTSPFGLKNRDSFSCFFFNISFFCYLCTDFRNRQNRLIK